MKLAIWILFIALLIAFASAGIIPKEEYLPPVEEEEQVAAEQPLEESAALAEDGYRYKTIKKLRHRRDVSELFAQGTLTDDGYHYHAPSSAEPLAKVAQEYLPPNGEATENKDNNDSEASQISNEYLPPTPEKETSETEVKETTEAPEISREYLPPTEAAATLDVPKFSASEELPSPSDDDAIVIEGPSESTVLADDGYHYRRIRYRRDVSEIVPPSGYSYESSPVNAEEINSAAISQTEDKEAVAEQYLPPTADLKEAPETAELADDGYRYKTVRKLKYRQRRDVSEIVTSAPVEEEESVSRLSAEYLPPNGDMEEVSEIPSETAELAEDGYRYKTIRKLKYRQRRDVSEIVAPESATLDKDGYHYRVPESSQVLPKVSNEYLPPSEELRELLEETKEAESTEAPAVTESSSIVPEAATAMTEAAPVVTETTASVTETPSTTPVSAISNEYLPPLDEVPLVKEASNTPAVSNQYLPPVEEIAEVKEGSEIQEETAVLADDGYHYKVGQRFRLRRDVSDIVPAENGYAYDAPAATNEALNIYLPPVEVKEAAESNENLQASSKYIPPAEEEESKQNDSELIEAPKEEESAVLADDGYHYKTVRRLKYRHRRDVSELVAPSVEESAILAKDGYHYKKPSAAIPKVANEYLPPVVAEVKEALNVEPTIAPEYLPPSEAAIKEASSSVVSNEYLPPTEDILGGDAEIIELPHQASESTVLADDGYRYKTVRRIRYRHRRDAPQPADGYNYNAPIKVESQYLAPVEEIPQATSGSAETATLADDGYRYKTVRRIRYRHRV